MKLLKRKISKYSSVSRDTDEERNMWLIQIVGGIKDIIVYGRQPHFLKRYEYAHTNACKSMAQFEFVKPIQFQHTNQCVNAKSHIL